ncbi:hypothetical protein ACHAWF_017854 [Thalassiosira exigua]
MMMRMSSNNVHPGDHDETCGSPNGGETASSLPEKPTLIVGPRNLLRPRASADRRKFASSLCTIESCAASLDIYDDGEDSQVEGLQNSNQTTIRRRHSLDMGRSSTNSLMVSFSRLNEQELTHLRKWNRRLLRTEVFDKYYFPAKWEANEMEALVRFLKLEDPMSKASKGGAGVPRGNLRSSVRSRKTFQSWNQGTSSDTSVSSGLSSSLTSSIKGSAGMLTKLLTEPKQQIVDPVKMTKNAIDFIFFPYVHDPKSVLLKRGSVFLLDPDLHNERELMIFSHGFLLADVVLEDAFNLFLALSDREFLTEKSFLDYLQNKFKEMDKDDTGEIEKWELQRLLTDMGIPMGESVLDELIQRGIISMTQTEKLDREALHKAFQGFFAQLNTGSPSPNVKPLGLDESSSERDASDGSNRLKNFFGGFQKKKTTKVEHAALFSSVSRVDSLNICHGDDATSEEIASSVYAPTAFSVTLSEGNREPMFFVCSKPEHRDAWVEAFRPGVIRALTKSSTEEMTKRRSQLGWQHLVIRSSYNSLVILNDMHALKWVCQEDPDENSGSRKLKAELNQLDEYNGYSPLHYATILGHVECMCILLEAGAKVTVEDREGLSSMYHGKRSAQCFVLDLLKHILLHSISPEPTE